MTAETPQVVEKKSLRERLDPRQITGEAPLMPLVILFGLNAVDELDRTAASGADGVVVSIRRPSLDDVFLAITTRDAAPASPELQEAK